MKTTHLSLITALAVGAFVAFTPTTRAQDNKDSDAKPKAPARARGPQGRAGGIDRIATELNLTDDQKQKLQTIMKDEADKLRELRQDTNLTADQRGPKAREIRTDAAAKVKALLSADQFEKWQKLRGQGRPARGAARAGQGGNANQDNTKTEK